MTLAGAVFVKRLCNVVVMPTLELMFKENCAIMVMVNAWEVVRALY